MAWLTRELTRVQVREHSLIVKRWHGVSVLLIIVVAVLLLALGVFAGYEYSYQTLPRPPLPPGQKAPGGKCPHVAGGCLPKQPISLAASITATTQGPDESNNTPVYGDSRWAEIGAHNSFAIFKVTEGTGYVDPTAAPMGRYARAHGLVVGGYDFLHVCGNSPVTEAQVFVYHLRADGLTGKGSLPGIGDAEFGGSGCDARAWINTWARTVYNGTGRWPMFYTGAWWWQPHLGAYWPNPSLAWVSGYGVGYPYMPSGRSQLDLWQFSDRAWNGSSSGDLSVWRDGARAFTALTGTTTPRPHPRPHRPKHCLARHWPHTNQCRRVRYRYHRLARQLESFRRSYS